jgi:hypothetical protein
MLSNSPYATTQIVALDVGPEPTRFLVHDSVLSRSKVLAAKSFPVAFVQQPVLLPELDQNTAHTLIHYLYTRSSLNCTNWVQVYIALLLVISYQGLLSWPRIR